MSSLTPKKESPEYGGKTQKTPTPSGVFKEGEKRGIPDNVVTRVNDVGTLVNTNNSKMTYAVIRGRYNVIISLRNKNGLVSVNIVTVLRNRVVSGFNLRHLPTVIEALNDMLKELEGKGITPWSEGVSKRGSVKVYE